MTIDITDRAAVMEAAAHYLLQDLTTERGPALENPQDVEQLITYTLDRRPNEEFWCLFLDTRHRVIEFERLFAGTIDGAAVYPRVVVERCLHHGAAALICAHNHPSGVSEPSVADQAVTRRLKDACGLLDVRLLDHFIVGDSCISMLSRGMI